MSIRHLHTVLITLILLGCSSHEELPPPDNPFDPGNPHYVSPTALIVSGPSEGEVIDTTGVNIAWEGNESASEYRYKFDSPNWSDWNTATSHTFDYLDEGNHSFQLQSRSVNGEEQAVATLLNFEVDAVDGPAAIVYPYMQFGNPGDTLTYQIIAEEVIDLFAIECIISINEDYLELIEVLDGELLTQWGGDPLIIQEMTSASVSLAMVAVEGTGSPFSGSTSIATLEMIIRPSAMTTSVMTAIEIIELKYLDPSLMAIDGVSVRIGKLSDR